MPEKQTQKALCAERRGQRLQEKSEARRGHCPDKKNAAKNKQAVEIQNATD